MNLTPKQVIEENVPARLIANPELQKEINSVILFDLKGENGGKWIIDLTKNSDWVQTNTEEVTPQMTVELSVTDFIGLVRKELNIQGLALVGRLKIKPLNSKVMKLESLIQI